MFSDKLALQIAAAATAAGIPKAGMLAIVEVETGGKPTEDDGRTPNFLFERHVFRRELAARQPAKVKDAERQGLAIPKWDKATQYRDERSSAQRLALLAKAKAIDEDCALRACSWGLPQIMGNECLEVGFGSATAMVDFLTAGGVSNHIELMVRFLKSRQLISAIERSDWAYVALRYNGKGYAQNQYDTRLAAASRKWERKLLSLEAAPALDWPEQHLTKQEVLALQSELRALGYSEAGQPDGHWGSRTTGALSAFQAHEGLTVTGHYDDATKAALAEADPRPVAPERAEATLTDLREAGSTTVANADKGSLAGMLKMGIGGGTVVASLAGKGSEAIDTAQSAVDKAGHAKTLVHSIQELLGPLANPLVLAAGVVLLVGGYLVMRYCERVKAARLADHQSGTHAGTMGD